MISILKTRHLSVVGIVLTILIAVVAQISALAADSKPASAGAREPITFSKDVAPILQAKCQECHQPNSIAPMSLTNEQGEHHRALG